MSDDEFKGYARIRSIDVILADGSSVEIHQEEPGWTHRWIFSMDTGAPVMGDVDYCRRIHEATGIMLEAYGGKQS